MILEILYIRRIVLTGGVDYGKGSRDRVRAGAASARGSRLLSQDSVHIAKVRLGPPTTMPDQALFTSTTRLARPAFDSRK